MTVRSDIRTAVRNELNDNGATKLWSDTLLNTWIAGAIRDWSVQRPLEVTWTQTTTANDGSYPLPDGAMRVLTVEYPSGYYRKRVPAVGGDVEATAGIVTDPFASEPLRFDVWNHELLLMPAPGASGETITVRYEGLYTVPTDDVTTLDVRVEDELALVYWACSRALMWIGVDEAKRQRFERDRGADPSALRGVYEGYYQEMARQRKPRPGGRRLVVRD